ncbi:MAG: hypothetical protein J6I97_07825, partial [Agathobacter sp.]|nr:hypothetical protein [Agathobacter sp.]
FETGEFDDTNHSGETEVKDAVKETCTTDGYSGDIYCKGCGDKLKDGKLILADHVYGTTYKADAENHWKECSCGDITEKATHTFNEWTVTKEASTMEKGRKDRVCSVCGYSELEETPMLETTSPKTGDYNALYLWLVFLTISCMCASGIVMKRKNN